MATKAKSVKAKAAPAPRKKASKKANTLTVVCIAAVVIVAIIAAGLMIHAATKDRTAPSPEPAPVAVGPWGADLADRKTIEDTDELRQTIRFLRENGDIDDKQEEALIVSIDRWGSKNAAFDDAKRAELRGVK